MQQHSTLKEKMKKYPWQCCADFVTIRLQLATNRHCQAAIALVALLQRRQTIGRHPLINVSDGE
jgi:hypothetical protein